MFPKTQKTSPVVGHHPLATGDVAQLPIEVGVGSAEELETRIEIGRERGKETEHQAATNLVKDLEDTRIKIGSMTETETEIMTADEVARSMMIIDGLPLLLKSQCLGSNRKICIPTDEGNQDGTDPRMPVVLMAVVGLVEEAPTLWRGAWWMFFCYISTLT